MYVEDGELKKMFGDHLLSVQGRIYHSTRIGDHTNIQWLLHDSNYYTYDHLDNQVFDRLRTDCLAAQQTPEGLYSLILHLSSSRPIVRMKCGHNGCNATANPTDALPTTCSNKTDRYVHNTYDMVRTLFTVIPMNSVHGCGPISPDGLPIPSTMSINTKVLEDAFLCDGEEYVNLDSDEQKNRSGWFIGTKYVAAVEKTKWGQNQRSAYQVVTLDSDPANIQRLQTSRRPARTTIDPSSDDRTAADRSNSKRKSSSSASNQKSSSNAKRSNKHVAPPSDTSSSDDDNNDTDNSSIPDSDCGSDDPDDDDVIFDDDDLIDAADDTDDTDYLLLSLIFFDPSLALSH
ncbi:unnamed protein product [Ectocarpus sp. CCAP 1310/34]|nr:unnamed protein product [Ectocarpus sp. CCAP 1310/34]